MKDFKDLMNKFLKAKSSTIIFAVIVVLMLLGNFFDL